MNQRGKVLLFRGGDPISWLVKVQTRSQYSHAAILLEDGKSCVESYPGSGVRIRQLTDADFGRIDIYDVRGMTDEMWRTAINFALEQLDKGYDWRSVLRFVSKVPSSDNSRWFCSELVFKAIAVAGVRLLDRVPSAEVSPAMINLSPLLIPV